MVSQSQDKLKGIGNYWNCNSKSKYLLDGKRKNSIFLCFENFVFKQSFYKNEKWTARIFFRWSFDDVHCCSYSLSTLLWYISRVCYLIWESASDIFLAVRNFVNQKCCLFDFFKVWCCCNARHEFWM